MMKRSAGFTMIELLVVMTVTGIALGAFALYLAPMEGAIEGGVILTEGVLRQARATALATTSAYRVSTNGPGALMAETAPSCSSATWTVDTDFDVELPREVEFTDTTWSVCYSSRGMADANVIVELMQPQRESRQIEVLRGGSTRVLP